MAVLLTTSLAFIAGTLGIFAIGLFVKDLIFGRNQGPGEPRLELVPPAPKTGTIDGSFHQLVSHAGNPVDVNTAILLVLASAILGGGTAFVLSEHLLTTAIGCCAGSVIPVLVLAFLRWRRLGKMRKDLPDALQMVADSVRSGQTLQQACELVGKESQAPLADDFQFAARQLDLGNSPLAVMEQLKRRIPIGEFSVFATAVLVHQRTGGDLGRLAERMARAARDRQDVRNHMLATTAGSRLSAIGMVIGAVIAMVVLGFLQPDYISAFFTHSIGPSLLAIAIGLQVIGGIWVWRILRLSY